MQLLLYVLAVTASDNTNGNPPQKNYFYYQRHTTVCIFHLLIKQKKKREKTKKYHSVSAKDLKDKFIGINKTKIENKNTTIDLIVLIYQQK